VIPAAGPFGLAERGAKGRFCGGIGLLLELGAFLHRQGFDIAHGAHLPALKDGHALLFTGRQRQRVYQIAQRQPFRRPPLRHMHQITEAECARHGHALPGRNNVPRSHSDQLIAKTIHADRLVHRHTIHIGHLRVVMIF